MFYLYAMIKRTAFQTPGPAVALTTIYPPVYTMNYPIYFTDQSPYRWKAGSFRDVDATMLANPNGDDSIFVANLINCLDAAGIRPLSPVHLWKAWSIWRANLTALGRPPSDRDQSERIVTFLSVIWGTLSSQPRPPLGAANPRRPLLKVIVLEIGVDDEVLTMLDNGFNPIPPAPPRIAPVPVVVPAPVVPVSLRASASVSNGVDALTNLGKRSRDQSDAGLSIQSQGTYLDDSGRSTRSRSEYEVKTNTVTLDSDGEDEEAEEMPPVTGAAIGADSSGDLPQTGDGDDEDMPGNDSENAEMDEDDSANATHNLAKTRSQRSLLRSFPTLRSRPAQQLRPLGRGAMEAVSRLDRAQTTAAAAASATTFTLYSRIFSPLTPPVQDNEGLLGPGTVNDSINNFISVLSNEYVILDDKLTSTSADVTGSANDEWVQRMVAITGASTISFKGTNTAGLVSIEDVTVSATAFLGLTFSLSTSISTTFVNMTNPGFLSDSNMMVLGVQAAPAPPPITFQEVFSLFDLPTGPALFALDATTPLTLDTSVGSRSGLYMQPNGSTTTWLRLTFTVDTDPVQDFLKFIGGDKLLKISNVKMYGLKKISCTRSDLTLSTQWISKLTIRADFDLGTDMAKLTAYLVLGPSTTELRLKFQAEQDFDGMIEWLLGIFNNNNASGLNVSKDDVHPSNLLPSGALADKVVIRAQEIAIILSNPTSGSGYQFQSLAITLEIDVFSACFFVTVSVPNFSLIAELWELKPPGDSITLLPFIEDYDYFTPLSTTVTG